MYAGTAYNTYAQNNVAVESPTKLIEMLYEGVLRFNSLAKKAMDEGNIEKRVYWTNRSVAIVTELIAILDYSQGDVAYYLEGLYNYQIELLTDAGLYNDASRLNECNNVFKELLEAWRETTNVA
ncbi:MAG: flagellar export chaperone FliS [Epsilonproteobacteria bacterium]|nr:flagellar export chaperone FliS [Campylobacterota bacterium]